MSIYNLYIDLEIDEETIDLDVDEVYGTSADQYEGNYIVTPKAFEQTVLETKSKLMLDDVTVLEIPYYRTSNPSGGDTIFIGHNEED